MLTPGQAGAQPFEPALPVLRMNRAVARFTSWGAALRTGAADSQDESRCGAIHNGNVKGAGVGPPLPCEPAMPGEPGNVALAGHRDGFFRPLKDIRLGDAISLNTLDGEFVYRVESTEVVWPSDVQVLRATRENTLTLVTCYPFYYVGSAPKRFIVRARQIGWLPLESPVAEAPHAF